MTAMDRVLASNNMLEPLAEEAVCEKIAVETVQKEMSEADEPNLLEEEDMHVFDREPLLDRLPLVSCNTCKKPIKASQYSIHAEHCRSINSLDETMVDLDGGSGHKKPPRKARRKMSPHESFVDGGRSQVLEDGISMDGAKSKISDLEGPPLSSSQLGKSSGIFFSQPSYNGEDADIYSGFQRNLLSARSPQPLATKAYYLNNHQRMRAVLRSLFHENAGRPVSSYTASIPIEGRRVPMTSSNMLSENGLNDVLLKPRHMLGIKKQI